MICIYHTRHPGALQTVGSGRIRCKVVWVETNAENLRSAVGAIAHAPPGDDIRVEIDGVMFTVDQLPKYGPDSAKHCRNWLDNRRRSQARSTTRPVFGL